MTGHPPPVDIGCSDVPTWLGKLDVRLCRTSPLRTSFAQQHEGPLRVLKALYPEGEGVCHLVLVHPPGGLVGGDALTMSVDVQADAHGLITTPGATRFYRTRGGKATQDVRIHVASGARLEWLPLETIVYPGAIAHNRVSVHLAPGAAVLGWDLICLGLPASGQAFDRGVLHQRLEVLPGWLECATIDAADQRLLQSPLGLAGRSVIGTAWLAWGEADGRDALAERWVDAARAAAERAVSGVMAAAEDGHRVAFGITRLQPNVIVARVLATCAEHAWPVLRAVRAAWRSEAWSLAVCEPRVWAT
jgi:urease accessory protein